MDFKNYVKMILEAEEAEDKNKKAKDEDEEDEDEEDEDEEDEDEDDFEASCKTHKNGCTGCEASVDDDYYEEDFDDYYEEDFDDYYEEDFDDYYEENNPLRESMLYSSNYIVGENLVNEEEKIRVQVLCESIKNNSASKFLMKLSTKATKDAEKLSSKGMSEKAKIARDSAKQLKEASTKIRRAEDAYKAGKPEAKKEYKALCKTYHKELKKQGRVARGIRNTMLSLVAASALLGTAGLTMLANDDIIPRLQDGVRDGDLGEVIKGMAIKDKEALMKLVDAAGRGNEKDMANIAAHKLSGDDNIDMWENTKKAIKHTAKEIDRNAYKNDGYNDARENTFDKLARAGKVVGIKNKNGEAFNYKDAFGKKK